MQGREIHETGLASFNTLLHKWLFQDAGIAAAYIIRLLVISLLLIVFDVFLRF